MNSISFDLTHNKKASISENKIKCNNCGDGFENKWNLMHHRKLKHLNTVALCRNNQEGRCTFTDEKCWWIHAEKKEVFGNIKCYNCDKEFETKSNMMAHRKMHHQSTVKMCSQFLNGTCRFKEQSCWFIHEGEDGNDTAEKNERKNKDETEKPEQVFRKVSEDLEPPILEKEELKKQSK